MPILVSDVPFGADVFVRPLVCINRGALPSGDVKLVQPLRFAQLQAKNAKFVRPTVQVLRVHDLHPNEELSVSTPSIQQTAFKPAHTIRPSNKLPRLCTRTD